MKETVTVETRTVETSTTPAIQQTRTAQTATTAVVQVCAVRDVHYRSSTLKRTIGPRPLNGLWGGYSQ